MENGDRLARLSEREKVCLRQWLQHKTAKEIAIDLGISHHAVEKRLRMARTKLDVASSLQAARMLGTAEGYGPTVAQKSDLSEHTRPRQAVAVQPAIFGAIAVSLIGAAAFALIVQPAGQANAPPEAGLLARELDQQLSTELNLLIATAEIGPDGRVFLHSPMGDQRFLEQNSGR